MKQCIGCLFLFSSLIWTNSLFAHPGIGIVMDSKGAVYYTDLEHVWKITPNGEHSIAVRDVHTHELYLDQEDNLYGEHIWYEGEATDKWGHYIWCLKNNGELVKVKPNTEGFPDNNTLVRDQEGTSYWTQKIGNKELLIKQTAKGKIKLHSPHKFKDVRWKFVPKDSENLYVVDYLQLKKVAPNGDVIIIADNLKERGFSFSSVRDRHYVMGLWSDKETNIYVAVYGAKKIKKISPSGHQTTIYESGRGWSPSGGLIGPDNSLWILEYSNRNKARVKRVTPYHEEEIYKNSK